MLTNQDYIQKSLELNLFILRIAKEHAIFAAAAMPATYTAIIQQLLELKNNTENLLKYAVTLSDGVISNEVISSMELVTDLTLNAEEKTQALTGIPIDTEITKMELALKPGNEMNNPQLLEQVSQLNQQAIASLQTAATVIENLLGEILACQKISHLYPSVFQHVLIETTFLTSILQKLQNKEDLAIINNTIYNELQLNWNEIMKDHAEFIRGQLDPSEKLLFNIADSYAEAYQNIYQLPIQQGLYSSFSTTANLRNFKHESTQALLECQIKTISLPLFLDHVTREANHYLRLLNVFVTQ